MRIGIDARFLGLKQKGIGRYIQKLVEHLQLVDHENEYILFLRKDNWKECKITSSNFKKVLADYRWYGLKEQFLMPLNIRRQKIDLMHFPHFNVPIFCFCPFVVTIHDLILKRFPTKRASKLGPFLYWFKNLAYRLTILLALKKAKTIIAISGFTKKDICYYFSVDEKKIRVIYEGASNIFYAKTPKDQTSKEYLFKKYRVKKDYFLYVGNAYPHKNLEKTIEAFLNWSKNTHQLVLVGEKDYFYQRLLNQYKTVGADKIIFTDYIDDKDLAFLYQNAFAYIFPSMCEGFGLPPLEAMSREVPVISSRATCLPEILENAALYFDPHDRKDLIEKIELLLSDDRLRKDLIVKGLRQVKKYDWCKTARQTQKVYQKSCSSEVI